ncbi:MAG: molybdenum cofactor biosynthesis protein MoaE [Microbacteriaceae bacterium]
MTNPLAIITDEPIEEAAIRAAVEAPDCGAVVLFCGVVRNHDVGRTVLQLDYQAHPEAQRFLADCCAQIADQTGRTVAAAHRVGTLSIGDVALYAAASAAHRAEAFDACERLVELIKHTVPIWKRQRFTDGTSEWVGL